MYLANIHFNLLVKRSISGYPSCLLAELSSLVRNMNMAKLYCWCSC